MLEIDPIVDDIISGVIRTRTRRLKSYKVPSPLLDGPVALKAETQAAGTRPNGNAPVTGFCVQLRVDGIPELAHRVALGGSNKASGVLSGTWIVADPQVDELNRWLVETYVMGDGPAPRSKTIWRKAGFVVSG